MMATLWSFRDAILSRNGALIYDEEKCCCSSSSSSSLSFSGLSSSISGSPFEIECLYEVSFDISWDEVDSSNFPDIDLYVNDTESTLTAIEDGWPDCDPTESDPTEVITEEYSVSRDFRVFFNQFSDCSTIVNFADITANVDVANLGTPGVDADIEVSGQVGPTIITPGNSATFDISDLIKSDGFAGFNTGDQSNFSGGVGISVRCL